MKIIFEPQALTAMQQWLTKYYPEEACGFLLGTESGDTRTIVSAWPATNISTDNRKRRFVVDPIDYLYAEKEAVNKGIGLLGIFHSHPDHPAIPSEHDLAAAHPFFSYTIVSVLAGKIDKIKSYQLHDDRFVEETVEFVTAESLSTLA